MLLLHFESALDDGWGYHPKHVELSAENIIKLYIVASCWTIIDNDSRCTDPWTHTQKKKGNYFVWAITGDGKFTGGSGRLSVGLLYWNGNSVAQPPQWMGHAVRPGNRSCVLNIEERPLSSPPPQWQYLNPLWGLPSLPIGKGVYFTGSKAAGAWGWPLIFICLLILRKECVGAADCKCSADRMKGNNELERMWKEVVSADVLQVLCL